jgi:hypothetical protein
MINSKYDFGLSWSGVVREYFVEQLKAACRKRGLSFLWISEENIKEALKKLESGRSRIKVLLDTEATYNKKGDLYARVSYAVKDLGGVVINDPDRTKAAIDKSIVHYELLNTGVTTPYTVVVRNWEPNYFKLTPEEKKMLGAPFVIKPALGYGQLGVVRDAKGSIREIARARNFDRGDNFLLQEKINPLEISGRRAWFRVFNVFDTIIPCWWDDHKNRYEHIIYEDFNNYRLYPLAKIVSRIASITRMAWFSTEVAMDKKDSRIRFVAIDYVNDQCDMSALSETTSGVPDNVVEYTANYITEAAKRLISHEKLSKKYTIWLKNASIEIRGLGVSPSLLNQKTSSFFPFTRKFKQ